MKTSAVLAVMATLASAVVAAPATSSPGRNYLADALKHPETTFATSNILPIFWTPVTKGAGVDDGFHGDAPKDGHLSGSWLQGLQSEGSPLFVLLVAILACGALVAILVTATRAIVKKVRNIKYKADNDVEEHKTPVGNVQPVILPVADRGLYAIAEADEKT